MTDTTHRIAAAIAAVAIMLGTFVPVVTVPPASAATVALAPIIA